MCAPPDFAELLAGVGVPMVPVGQSARALTKAAPPGPFPPDETNNRVRATAVAGTIRTDGTTVAAKLLLDRSC